jgi:hypothetical protein
MEPTLKTVKLRSKYSCYLEPADGAHIAPVDPTDLLLPHATPSRIPWESERSYGKTTNEPTTSSLLLQVKR